jgi:hypothetical protein
MNPQWFDPTLLLKFYETVVWVLIWLMAAIFVAELVCILALVWKRASTPERAASTCIRRP